MFEAVVGSVWVDTQRDLVATGAIIDNLLGPLIINYVVYGETPIHRLWGYV